MARRAVWSGVLLEKGLHGTKRRRLSDIQWLPVVVEDGGGVKDKDDVLGLILEDSNGDDDGVCAFVVEFCNRTLVSEVIW